MDVSGTNLTMIQGDSESLTISRKDSNGLLLPFVEGDVVHLTVKTAPTDVEHVFQKEITSFVDGKAIIEIDPVDTNEIAVQSYFYDIQLTTAAGKVTTLVKPSKLTLKMGIT